MTVQLIPGAFSICQAAKDTPIDFACPYVFVGVTDEELSLVCPTDRVPAGVLRRDDGWRAFRFAGVLDFSLVGILAEASAVLARRRIGLFAVSTFNRSYIFVKQDAFEQALAALAEAGYTIDRCPVSR